ncbi:Fc.00g010020.m01.CDS01 [Cosmosporella sp. VM-42]
MSSRPSLRPSPLAPLLSLLVFLLISATIVAADDSATVWVTPHDAYSSSIGVLGCKVDTNRIAYWPGSVDCTNICISLSYGGRNVHLLRVDQSQGAYDVSYDAWNYLYTGHAATDKPTAGGPIEMQFKNEDASKCNSLIHTDGHKLPLSASNSMNFLVSCLDNSSWVGENYVLYNIADPICTIGYDEKCNLDWPNANQASCSHALGLPEPLKGDQVVNIRYPTGEKVVAGTGQAADDSAGCLSGRPNMKRMALGWMSTALVAWQA